jgi:hypothetical membrane protein
MVTGVRSWGEALSRAWHGPAAGRVFAIAGVVAAGVYVAGDVVSGLLYPGYSFRDQWISELTARGSPVRPVMLGVMTLHGLLGAGLALGIWRSAGGSRSLRPVGPLLVTAGAVGFFTHVVFPMSSRGMRPSFSDTMHMALSMAWGVVTFSAMILYAIAYQGWPRVCSILTFAVMLGFGTASSIAIQGIEENDTPWAGAFERINAYTLMAWLVVVAVTVMPPYPRDGQPERG